MARTAQIVHNGKSQAMWDVAHELQALAPAGSLTTAGPEHKSGYIALSTRSHKVPNKNAVSVHAAWVGFMVPDWSMEVEIQAAGLVTKQHASDKRLRVFGVTTSTISQNSNMFVKLIAIAREESETRLQLKNEKNARGTQN